MTQLLISVTSLDEAGVALESGADFIDLKNPDEGALGALPIAVVSEIVSFVKSQKGSEPKYTSATIGDLPMNPELIVKQVKRLADTGVDIIKIGFFENSEGTFHGYEACLSALRNLAHDGLKLIAVLFAEFAYPAGLTGLIKNAGFYGVMLDTAYKNGGTLMDYYPDAEVNVLHDAVCKQGMLFGLAGSLSIQNLEKIKEFKPDYIGFRGGVCIGNQRRLKLDPDKILALRQVM